MRQVFGRVILDPEMGVHVQSAVGNVKKLVCWLLRSAWHRVSHLTPVGRGTQMGSLDKAKHQCSIAHASANDGLALLCGQEWFRKTIGQ